jgi:hypothetical protein
MLDAQGGVQHVLEVVEDQKGPAILEVLLEALEHRRPRIPDQLEGHRDLRQDHLRVGDRREIDEPHPVLERGEPSVRHLERETGLPGAAGPGQREQPGLVQEGLDLSDRLLSSDEPAHLRRQVVGPGVQRAQWRERRGESLDGELEQPFRVGEVLQPVLAEVGDLHTVGECPPDQRLRRSGDEDLSSVPGIADAGGPMDVDAHVSVARSGPLAGVEPHPDPDLRPVRPGVGGDRLLGLHHGPDRRAR